MLDIKNLSVNLAETQILKEVSLTVKKGETHFIMGPNGAGKSTLAQVLAGNPGYKIKKGEILFNKKRINKLTADKRAKLGMFLAFQHPLEFEGIKMFSFLKEGRFQLAGRNESPVALKKEISFNLNQLGMADSFSDRYLNFGFSGGEKKKSEILQVLILKPKLAILDEIDSGLDVDSLKLVASSILKLKRKSKTAFLIITHLPRLAHLIKPDFVHIMIDGKITKSGDKKLIPLIRQHGYSYFQEK